MSFDLSTPLDHVRGESIYSAPAGPNDFDYLLDYLTKYREQESPRTFPGSYTGEMGGFGLARVPPNEFTPRSYVTDRLGGIQPRFPEPDLELAKRKQLASDMSSTQMHGGGLMIDSRPVSSSKATGSRAPVVGDHIESFTSDGKYAHVRGDGLSESFVVPMYDEFGVPRDATSEQKSFGYADRARDVTIGSDLMYRPKREHGPMFAFESDIGINAGYLPQVFARAKFEDHARMTHHIGTSGVCELPAPAVWQGPGIGLSPDEIARPLGVFNLYRPAPESIDVLRSAHPKVSAEMPMTGPVSRARSLPAYGTRERRDPIELPSLPPASLSSRSRHSLHKRRPVAQRTISKGRELPFGSLPLSGSGTRPDFIGGPAPAYPCAPKFDDASRVVVRELSDYTVPRKTVEYYRDSDDIDVGAYIVTFDSKPFGHGPDTEFGSAPGFSAGPGFPGDKLAVAPTMNSSATGPGMPGFTGKPSDYSHFTSTMYSGAEDTWAGVCSSYLPGEHVEGSSRINASVSHIKSQREKHATYEGSASVIRKPPVPVPDSERRAPVRENKAKIMHGLTATRKDVRDGRSERIEPQTLKTGYIAGHSDGVHTKSMHPHVRFDIALTKRDLVVAKDYIPGIIGKMSGPDSRMAAHNMRTSSRREETMKMPMPHRRGPSVPVGPTFSEYSRTRLSIERPEMVTTGYRRGSYEPLAAGSVRLDDSREIGGYSTSAFRESARGTRFLGYSRQRLDTRSKDFVAPAPYGVHELSLRM